MSPADCRMPLPDKQQPKTKEPCGAGAADAAAGAAIKQRLSGKQSKMAANLCEGLAKGGTSIKGSSELAGDAEAKPAPDC